MKPYLVAVATICTLLMGCVTVPYDGPQVQSGGVYGDPYPAVYGYGYDYAYPVYPAPRAYPYYYEPQRGYPPPGYPPHRYQRPYPAERQHPPRDVQRPPPAALQGQGNAEVYQRNRDRNSDGAPTWRAPSASNPPARPAPPPGPVQPEVYQRNRDRDSDGSPTWGPPAR